MESDGRGTRLSFSVNYTQLQLYSPYKNLRPTEYRVVLAL